VPRLRLTPKAPAEGDLVATEGYWSRWRKEVWARLHGAPFWVAEVVGGAIASFGGAAVVLAWVLGLAGLVCVAALFVTPVFQRDEARVRLHQLTTTEFRCWPRLERVGWKGRFVPGKVIEFVHEAVLWVFVENSGPTSEFTARIREVSGVPSAWGDPYSVDQPLWDGEGASSVRIEKGGRRKLRIASILNEPICFWFWTSEMHDARPGHQWMMLAGETPVSIEFVLDVVNSGEDDQTVRSHGRIDIPTDLSQATFGLEMEERR
jgi:hypothetical protein